MRLRSLLVSTEFGNSSSNPYESSGLPGCLPFMVFGNMYEADGTATIAPHSWGQ
jgi:hypothetical protein